jgi:leader peptidase (prepilin peptidase) / N-methyltransferase
MYWTDILVLITGMCWGSFLCLVAYRAPRKISLAWPLSFCESCNKPISFWQNIPVLGFLLLKGRCDRCKSPIPLRYPIVELITGLLFVFIYERLFIDYYSLARALLLVTAVIPSILTDLDFRIIPDRISIGLIICGFILGILDPQMGWKASLIGIVVGGGMLYGVAELYYRFTGIEGIGGGDIKLLAGIGALFGWYNAIIVIMLSSLLGSAFGLIMIFIFKKERTFAIPYGPFIGFAAIAYHFLFEGGFIG